MSDSLSSNIAYLKPSETVAISAETKRRRAEGEDIVDLSVGEPDFNTPKAASDAGIAAILKGYTRYPPNIGIPELRAAVARNLSLMSGEPGDQSGSDRDQLRVEAVDLQRLFHALRSQGQGADPVAGVGFLSADCASVPGRAGHGAR